LIPIFSFNARDYDQAPWHDLANQKHMRLSQNFSFWESNLEIRGFARLKA
jgi:hypothetical protein